MTCSVCAQWASRTREQLDNRKRKVAAAGFDDGPTFYPCPTCGTTDWALTEAMLGPELARDRMSALPLGIVLGELAAAAAVLFWLVR